MGANLKKVMKFIQKEVNSEWSKLDFEYNLEKDSLEVLSDLTLNNHDDNIRGVINVYSGGMANFRAVFDKAEPSAQLFQLLNEFNENNRFFTAFLREDGYLELRHVIAWYDEKTFKAYTGEYLIRLAKLADDETLQRITQFTSSN